VATASAGERGRAGKRTKTPELSQLSATDLLLATIRETVYRRSLPLATRELVVKRSELGDLAGVVGAAVMVTDELFRPTHLAQWLGVGTPNGGHVAAAPH
jgi:hypothetical protein